jgi:signal transduction histidine kinase
LNLRRSFSSISRDHEAWLMLLFLLLGILVPAGSIIWFSNSAAKREAETARREISAAYQGQLRLMRDQLDAKWKERATDLTRIGSFQRVVEAALADSAIFLQTNGAIAYPLGMPLQRPAPLDPPGFARAQQVDNETVMLYARAANDSQTAARGVQAQIRELVQLGERDRAIDLIERFFARGPGFTASDVLGRRIAADEFLLAIDLLPISDPRRNTHMAHLTAMLADYENRMPSAQRLFLMREGQRLGLPEMPTFQAEALAARFLDADQPRAAGKALQATNLPNVWKLPSSDGRVIALFTTQSVEAFTSSTLKASIPAGAQLAASPPGVGEADIAVPAGAMLPGWQLSLSLTDARLLDAESSRRRNLYLWTGYLAIAGLVSMFLLLGRSFRKQLRLAHLKTDMVAAVSHELRTPLASMRLLTDALVECEAVESPDRARIREYLALISAENQRLTRLAESFLTFSRLEKRQLPFEFRDARPEEIVTAAVSAVREQFKLVGCDVSVQTEAGLPTLRVDPDALATALVNLLDNAYKFTPPEKQVMVRVYPEKRHVVFAVTDNGVGIAADQQKRIFRSFYQADQTLSRETGGCGLGLSIVKYIVGAHGGSATVASRPGEGSTFSIALPMVSRS